MHFTKEKMMKFMMFFGIVLLCAGIMAIILFGVKQFKIGSQLASVNQVANLSHLLVRQQANLFSMLLMNNAKTERLVENLDNFAKEEFVLDAAVYARNGELLAQSTNSSDMRSLLGLDKKEENEKDSQQIVEPIYSPNGVEGFLRVTFDAKYGQTTQSKINQIFHRLYGEIIIVFLAGILLASSLHYFLSHYRRSRIHVVEKTPVLRNKTTQSMSKLFHQRRRRVK
ncbi:hemolysin regulation protein AhpA [Aggregatibacter actinomycetemcomitans]|uniref:Hemolysin regulation protein AhpA n=2 Tax=Aggregatibacter actinomycetemcomitans TaxID=714 RepID=A0A142FZ43_AGGAC|nr:YtjB family periplasmic protein [Aggregatibacter actinomycetemcomitans]AFI87575.1 hemolysin regulation protein AhpA [Aggregatibacter actinomycetemcomitans D7S-1]AMQ93673.1 hemolysin regulation protein AhpA [Aggregatibacter actinomycetemcomitans]ANU81253.1 hemolysin regulation protein AhpA [Aggregatibacter actinomycetemcomitans]KND82933.1 hemolysin regulation protein AhpA [Aggregatibacter actinomycetemcomitans serotype a str. H5P1]KOE32048.1 hemolysin regulation protein AhpA [Aggregatibacter